MSDKRASAVTFTVDRKLNRATDNGAHRRRVKDSAIGFVDIVFGGRGEAVKVRHNVDGEGKKERSIWTIETPTQDLSVLEGAERRRVVSGYKDAVTDWAKKTLGSGVKVTLTIEDPPTSVAAQLERNAQKLGRKRTAKR